MSAAEAESVAIYMADGETDAKSEGAVGVQGKGGDVEHAEGSVRIIYGRRDYMYIWPHATNMWVVTSITPEVWYVLYISLYICICSQTFLCLYI